MNLKNKPILFFILSLILYGAFYACSDDNAETPPEEFARLSDVSLKQTVNGKESVDMDDTNTEITFISQLTFNNKTIKWPIPTLEQSFDKLFNIAKENIIVTNAQGSPITTVDITVDKSNKVKVAFSKVDNTYDYMKSSTFKVSVKTKLKEGITDEELTGFKTDGYRGQSVFYGESAAKNIKSNLVSITLSIVTETTYDIKGDPNNDSYPYKLNVVYFVPSDMQANPDYQKRISTILLKHQLFVCKWMKHWGYEEKSFGLPLDENGMVKIMTINAKGPKADYPYSGGGPKIRAEVEEYYRTNNITPYSKHTLVISATKSTDGLPFYGMGTWCYALDYPDMAFEAMAIDPITGRRMNPQTNTSHKATVWIGGMLHELGHGLNEPHIGPTYSHKNDPDFGITLMGSGNRAYGEVPAYMHPSSAAIMNNCQISSKITKDFYTATPASVKIVKVAIDGNSCTIEGHFNAPKNVKDIVVRYYNASETFLGGSHGYTSVGFVVKPTGNTFEAIIPIEELRINTFDYKLGLTILMDNGTTKSISQPYIYKLVKNSSGYTLESEAIVNDGSWEVTTSHPLPQADATISNAPGSLIDGDLSTCLSMVKPGKSYDGIKVAEGETVYAIINFKKQLEFNTIMLINRNYREFLNAKAVSFYGSNDGKSFVNIKVDVSLSEDDINTITLTPAVKYQYLRIILDKWDANEGNTVQFAELVLQNKN